ncbi:BREX system P-loop protein BrxC [Mycolicibacterium austroafricanum]|uniref:BREX system P-loop protein BrxC n=1 Tax=Mycolicibacterium austroafricanum TaxID=39687 RepID=UPI001CA302E6|nr:BREX system P-loop protein BrxC [Mycolicibacterium austroafricanum]QZT60280.1 BREX system P-loop protein BrxC [Mycolicibacterium austroafricanum]
MERISMLNREVFAVDPTGRTLPNDGVTTIDTPQTDAERAVLKYELEQFVAEGEYREGLRRVLNSYLTNVDRETQPACWVSGFYGSGKSHFMRVLAYLWTNPTIDGVAARSLVQLPDDIAGLLKEIDNLAKRDRTITFAAAGRLDRDQSSSVAQPLLKLILEAAGLPTQYGPARFTMWLQEDGLWESFLTALQSRGKDASEVNRNLFVSSAVRDALLEVKPGWAASPADAGKAISANFQVRDISDDAVIDTIRQVLEGVARKSEYGSKSKMPLTLLVIDEMQQYLADDVQLLLEVENTIERLTRQFESRLLVVAAGQSALTANEMLARFQDRFTVPVQLQSRDVETVVRQVVLRKSPVHVPALTAALDSVKGEIARHLGGSKLAAVPADQDDFVPDYPLLPTRRRFIESALRAVDRGAAGQLRSQLRVTLEAVGEVANAPLGNVVAGEVIFRSKKEDMLNQGVLLHELGDRIASVRDGSPDGDLKARAVELVFLISQLDESEGLQSNADTLADLMVTDLNAGSATLRARLPDLLQPMVGDLLVLDDGEYRLQSPADAEWNRAFKERRQAYLINTAEQLQVREDALRSRLQTEVSTVKVTQGITNTPRKVGYHYGEAPPQENDTELTVWVRSGWDTTESTVRTTVAEQGMESPIVTVLLPKTRDQDFRSAIADWRAAAYVLSTQPPPTTDEGQKARDAMDSQERRARDKVEGYAAEVLAGAQVYLGGGEMVGGTGSAASALSEALRKAAVRKFPRFRDADHSGWPSVFRRAKEGGTNALTAVGHEGPPSTNPVVKEIKGFLQGKTNLGSAVLKHFQAARYGWPKDAVVGALAMLVLSEEVSAWDGARQVSATQLTESAMTKLQYRVEQITLTFQQRQKLKQLANTLGVSNNPVDVPACLAALTAAASQAGGPAPLPPPPDTAAIAILQGKIGTERDAAVADAVDDLLASHNSWTAIVKKAESRLKEWDEAIRLVEHTRSLPTYADHRAVLDAIDQQRSLLVDPNPLADVTSAVKADLRSAANAAYQKAVEAQAEQVRLLEAVPQWNDLPVEDRGPFLEEHGMNAPAPPELTNDTVLLNELDRRPLSACAEMAPAFAGRGAAARRDLVERFTPQATPITPPPALINSDTEADEYLSTLRSTILAAGYPVSIES